MVFYFHVHETNIGNQFSELFIDYFVAFAFFIYLIYKRVDNAFLNGACVNTDIHCRHSHFQFHVKPDGYILISVHDAIVEYSGSHRSKTYGCGTIVIAEHGRLSATRMPFYQTSLFRFQHFYTSRGVHY